MSCLPITRRLELNGGRVTTAEDGATRLALDPAAHRHKAHGYANAQIDNYDGLLRRRFPHRPPFSLSLRARFAHPDGPAIGTAGFGLWNSPYGDVRRRWPTWPAAVWFFYAAPPNDLPFLLGQTGWHAAVLDGSPRRVGPWLAAAPIWTALFQSSRLRARWWPRLAARLGIACTPLPGPLDHWRRYRLDWTAEGCALWVDGQPVLRTPFAPRRRLGFVAWIDNQYLIARPTGRLAAGVSPLTTPDWLEVADLALHA